MDSLTQATFLGGLNLLWAPTGRMLCEKENTVQPIKILDSQLYRWYIVYKLQGIPKTENLTSRKMETKHQDRSEVPVKKFTISKGNQ